MVFKKIVNKCLVFGCNSGYQSSSKVNGNLVSFFFPFNKPDLLQDWIRFVNRRDWKPTTHSVLCELHFNEKFISRGKRCKLLHIIRSNTNPSFQYCFKKTFNITNSNPKKDHQLEKHTKRMS